MKPKTKKAEKLEYVLCSQIVLNEIKDHEQTKERMARNMIKALLNHGAIEFKYEKLPESDTRHKDYCEIIAKLYYIKT